MLSTDKHVRKEQPIARGVLDYFPNALAEVAHVSFVGNQQHNPGEPMHWAKHKSTDHSDCIVRHLIERGSFDDDGLRHTAKAAWRALALLQIEIDEEAKARHNAKANEAMKAYVGMQPKTPFNKVFASVTEAEATVDRRDLIALKLLALGCPPTVAKQITGGITFGKGYGYPSHQWVYLAGPMRGKKEFNFPAFDKARDLFASSGISVISPADIDRHAGDGWKEGQTEGDPTPFVLRDFWSLFLLRKLGDDNGIVLLDGWTRSTGATAELFTAKWLGLQVYTETGMIHPDAKEEYVSSHD